MEQTKIMGWRRFLLSESAVIVFGVIMILKDSIDPFNLGLGIGIMLSPHAATKAFEKFGKKATS